jgi:hypothetical protein
MSEDNLIDDITDDVQLDNTSERRLTTGEYDTDEEEEEEEDEDEEDDEVLTDMVGYIYIRCHGRIIQTDPNTGQILYPVPVPEGKTIIKKNQSSCGAISLNDNIDPTAQDTDNNEYIERLIYNIDTCVELDTYRHKYNSYREKYPIDDTSCNIMRNKDRYLMKEYTQQVEQTDVDGRTFVLPDIDVMYFVTTYRDGRIKNKYNLFKKRQIRELFKDHKWHWTRETIHKNNTKELLKKFLIISQDETNQLDLSGVYDKVTTKMIFDIISVLPYTTIKILDRSCNQIHRDGNIITLEDINYDYSKDNTIGYGGSKKTRRSKRSKRRTPNNMRINCRHTISNKRRRFNKNICIYK